MRACNCTGGKVEGEMTVNGHQKDQRTFSRVCGYVEQVGKACSDLLPRHCILGLIRKFSLDAFLNTMLSCSENPSREMFKPSLPFLLLFIIQIENMQQSCFVGSVCSVRCELKKKAGLSATPNLYLIQNCLLLARSWPGATHIRCHASGATACFIDVPCACLIGYCSTI